MIFNPNLNLNLLLWIIKCLNKYVYRYNTHWKNFKENTKLLAKETNIVKCDDRKGVFEEEKYSRRKIERLVKARIGTSG